MILSKLEKVLSSFAVAHRDNKLDRRFSTMVTGGAGIGKTDIVKKVATDNDMAVVITHVAQLEPGDLIGIPRSKKKFASGALENIFSKAESARGFGQLTYLLRHLFELFFESESYMVYDLPNYLPHYKKDRKGAVLTKAHDDGVERKVLDILALGAKVKNREDLIRRHGDDWHEKVKGAVIFFDEINRAAGDDTKNAIFELPGDYALHEYKVPDHCVVFAAGNPSTSEYQVNEMDQEKAWMDRFVHLKAENSVGDALLYFTKRNFYPSIISFINSDEEALMEREEPYAIEVKRTPRSYEVLNNILQYVDLPKDESIMRDVFMGILGTEYGVNFSNHYRENTIVIPKGDEIVFSYPSVQPQAVAYVNENRIDAVNQMTRNLLNFLLAENAAENFYKKADAGDVIRVYEEFNEQIKIGDTVLHHIHISNVERFVQDLPKEVRFAFVKQIAEIDAINEIFASSKSLVDTLKKDGERAFGADGRREG